MKIGCTYPPNTSWAFSWIRGTLKMAEQLRMRCSQLKRRRVSSTLLQTCQSKQQQQILLTVLCHKENSSDAMISPSCSHRGPPFLISILDRYSAQKKRHLGPMRMKIMLISKLSQWVTQLEKKRLVSEWWIDACGDQKRCRASLEST